MQRFAHLALAVRNMTASSQFYQEALGWKPVKELHTEKLSFLYMDAGQITVELLQYQEDPCAERLNGRLDHLAFEVDNLDEEIKRLKAMGVHFLSPEPRKGPEDQRIIFFSGPDGERIELVELAHDSTAKTSSSPV